MKFGVVNLRLAILEPGISSLISIPGDSAFSDIKHGDLFLTNWNSGKDRTGEDVQGLKSSTDKGRGYFYSFMLLSFIFFSFKLFKVIIQRKMTKKKGNK